MKFKEIERALIFGILIFAATSASAVTWDEALNAARSKNLKYQSSKASLEAAEHAAVGAHSSWYPSVSVFGTRQETDRELDLLETNKTENIFGLQLDLNLFGGFSSVAKSRLGEVGVSLARAEDEKAWLTIRAELREVYSSIRLLQRRISFVERTVARRRRFAELMEVKYRGGLEAKWSVEQARVEIENLTYELESRRLSIAERRKRFEILTGLPASTELADVKYPAVDEVRKQARSLHPEVASLRERASQENLNRRLAASAFWPRLDVNVKHRRFQEDSGPWGDEEVLGLTATWSLFSGFDSLSSVRESRAKQAAFELQFEQRRREIDSDREIFVRQYELAVRALGGRRRQLAVAEARLDVVENQYRSGRRSFLELESAQNFLSTSERDALDAEDQVIQVLSNLESVFAVPDEKRSIQ